VNDIAEYPSLAEYLEARKHVVVETEDKVKALLLGDASAIHVAYSGSGDSGQIDGIEVVGVNGSSVKLSHEQEKLVEDYCYDQIEKLYGGWENDDGGCGEFEIDMFTGEVHWSHTTYFTESSTEEHDL